MIFVTDPLARGYACISSCAFSENRVIDSGKLEGIERCCAGNKAKLPWDNSINMGRKQCLHYRNCNAVNSVTGTSAIGSSTSV